jgi:hypothetical protein
MERDYYADVRDVLRDWAESGESLNIIREEVADILEVLEEEAE